MSIETDSDRAVFFNAAEMGTAALYTPQAGGPFGCTLILDLSDEGERRENDARPLAGRIPALARRTEIANPAQGDTFTFGAEFVLGAGTYLIMNRPMTCDSDAALWSFWIIKQ